MRFVPLVLGPRHSTDPVHGAIGGDCAGQNWR
jgi:hypothetical protein